MIRRALFDVLLFLSPFAIYAFYLYFAPKPEEGAMARVHPWTLLFASGLILVALSFVFLGVEEGQGQRGTYVPPHVENGQVIPGHIENGGEPNAGGRP